ncbi:MAG: HDOD domain-containing protein [Bacteroidetes bacterium]|jgi:HD-like signal output (HDOD) protein|nr:HDOD domain-containing protein [Bacteroidota bacterium]
MIYLLSDHINRRERIVSLLKNLPKLPQETTELLKLVDNPKTTAPQLARFVSSDLMLTNTILKLTNSKFYGFTEHIRSINHAIVVLGFSSIKDIALLISVSKVFTAVEYYKCIGQANFYHHSIATAAGCKIIADKSSFKVSGEIFFSGFLHDIGILVLSNNMADKLLRIMEDASAERISLHDSELRVLGFSHADVGGYLLEKWHIALHQCSAIHNYPAPWLSPKIPNVAMMINFSDILARKTGFSLVECDNIPEIHPKVISYLNLRQNNSGDVEWGYYQDLLMSKMKHAKSFLELLKTNK